MEVKPQTPPGPGARREAPGGRTTARRAALPLRWRLRARRFVAGANVGAAVALAAVLLVAVNVLASRLHLRANLSTSGDYALSDKTRTLLAGLRGDLRIVSFFETDHEAAGDVRRLLDEYAEEARQNPELRVKIERLDPHRDLGRVRELKQTFGLSEPNVVAFELEGRRKYVRESEIMEYQRTVDGSRLLAGQAVSRRRRVAFRGEQAFSSAIHNVSQPTIPVVYFTSGHGEHEIDDFGSDTGFAGIGRLLRRENVETRKVLLAALPGLPADCSLLVVAGPTRGFPRPEADAIRAYLDRGGRLMVMADPGVVTGLEELLEQWGVRLGNGVVMGHSMTGQDLLITDYGDHPITRALRNVMTLFYEARPVDPVERADATGETQDRPRVTVLASNPREFWVESQPRQTPLRFDAGEDRPGPVGVAAAAERGPAGAVALGIRSSRAVVFGDSDFVCNGALRQAAGGNGDLFLGAANWLLERSELMGIGPRTPGELRLDLTRRQMAWVCLLAVVAVPGALCVLGFLVWLRRHE